MVAKSGIEPVNGVFELCSKSSLLTARRVPTRGGRDLRKAVAFAQIRAGAALEPACVTPPLRRLDAGMATASVRACAKIRHQSGKAVALSGCTRLAPSASMRSLDAARHEGARSTHRYGAIGCSSLRGNSLEVASYSTHPFYHMPCMR